MLYGDGHHDNKMKNKIQSILFDKRHFPKTAANKWMKKHNIHPYNVAHCSGWPLILSLEPDVVTKEAIPSHWIGISAGNDGSTHSHC